MNSKKTIHLYYLASVLFYIVAITKFFSTGFSSGVVWLCLGSAFLCIGSTNNEWEIINWNFTRYLVYGKADELLYRFHDFLHLAQYALDIGCVICKRETLKSLVAISIS